jgi:hypothetical protein
LNEAHHKASYTHSNADEKENPTHPESPGCEDQATDYNNDSSKESQGTEKIHHHVKRDFETRAEQVGHVLAYH